VDQFLAAYDAVLARWPVPHEALDVPTSFGTTRVQACGPPDRAPLVLLPGGGATSAMWFANVEALHRTNRVLAVDIMGDAGRSVPNDRLRTRSDLMTWLDEVLDHLELPAVALCGYSYGAKIALEYALHAPHRVRRLALLEPTACFAGMSPRYLLHAAPLLLRPSNRRLRALFGWEAGDAGPLDATWLDLTAAASEVSTRLVIPRRPSRARLRGLTVATLVLLAGRSRAHDIDRVAAGARRSLPDVTIGVLPDVSHHGVPFRHAERLNRELLAFLG
jgi:pimeloyl-ACP methyl ester carboxylesterase